nr:26K protein - pig (fragments) [Sus scrofa domesticus]
LTLVCSTAPGPLELDLTGDAEEYEFLTPMEEAPGMLAR